jgi:serine/threonine protein kinase
MLVDTHTDDVDGLPVWDWAEGCEVPGGTFAIERLGVGHRCETWLVWSVQLWAPAVLKAARPHQLRHPRAVKSLRRETAALAGNLHPALPRLFADGTDYPIPHVLVEYVDGPTLADELEDNGLLSVPETANLGAQLLPALMTLHSRQLAHLDVKPDNVVLRDGRPVLIDFGSTRRIGSEQPAGHPVGTEGYASPAQEACEAVSAEMDLYSLGRTLAEACRDLPDGLRFLLAPHPTTQRALAALADAAGELRPWPAWLRA